MDDLKVKIEEYLATSEGPIDIYRVSQSLHEVLPQYSFSQIAETLASSAVVLKRPLLWEKW